MAEIISKSFWMNKIQTANNGLIFRHKLIKPVQLTPQHRLSYLEIHGFKNWMNNFIENLLSGSLDTSDDFLIKVAVKDSPPNNSIELHLIQIPPIIFTWIEMSKICSYIQNLINNEMGSGEIEFIMNGNGFLYFSVKNKKYNVYFGNFLCHFFGFDSNDVSYDYTTKKTTFFIMNSFRDFRLGHVGISLNLLFNKSLSFYGGNDETNSENHREIIALLDSRDVCFTDFFKKVLINGKQDFDFKTHSFYEIELRFINLQTGQILRSFSSENEQMFCTLCFS